MHHRTYLAAAAVLVCTGAAPALDRLPAPAESTADLAAMGHLVIGAWEADDSRHVFEWGVGQRAIHSKSYFKDGDDWSLVSEGMWFWDPTATAIRGVVVAVAMPVDLFQYTSEVRGDTIVHDLVSHGEAGGRYVETWRIHADGYEWTLQQNRGGTLERVMGGSYRRASR